MMMSSNCTMTSSAMLHAPNKAILAPMVRVGTLPMRLLALEYGADLVYGEELIDFKFVHCRRVENKMLGTVDFVSKEHKVLFRTCAAERDRVVFQMGTADPVRALKVAQLVQNDVAAIDINMGCPKSFSLQGGMGAALLRQPDKAVAILTTLVKNISKPITCKIRLLETLEESLQLVKTLTSTGIAAIGVHARYTAERPRDAPHYDYLPEIVKASQIPVIVNGASGDIQTYADMVRLRERCGVASIMVARAAQWNPSVFRREGILPLDEVVSAYLKHAINYDNYFENTKFVVSQMLHENLSSLQGARLSHSQSMAELCDIWGVKAYLEKVETERGQKSAFRTNETILDEPTSPAACDAGDVNDGASVKRRRTIVEVDVKINGKLLSKGKTPKALLNEYCCEQKLHPKFDTQENKETKSFKSEVMINGEVFSTRGWLRTKQLAEHAAAIAFLLTKAIPVEIVALER